MAEEKQSPEQAEVTGHEEKKSDKKRLGALIAVILVVLAAGGGGAFWWKKTRAEQHAQKHPKAGEHASAKGEEEEEEEGDHPPTFFSLEKIVVKLHKSNTSSVEHYLQVGMDLKLSDHKANQKLTAYSPVIKHEIMLILSSKEFEWLDDMEHKKQLALEIRTKVNKIIKAPTPKEGVKAVYFGSFIVQ